MVYLYPALVLEKDSAKLTKMHTRLESINQNQKQKNACHNDLHIFYKRSLNLTLRFPTDMNMKSS